MAVAAPVAGVLTITGDNNDDSVLVSGSATDAQTFTIKGLHGTKINGVANGSVTETGVNDIQTALWGDGKDYFGFTDSNPAGLMGDLLVTMGNGNDEVELGKVDVHDDHSRGDNKAVTNVGGTVEVLLGNGNDEVEAENFSVNVSSPALWSSVIPGSTAPSDDMFTGGQGFFVTMGNGNDKVEAENVTVTFNSTVPVTTVALAAVPTVGNEGFFVTLGNGNDKVEAEDVTVTVNSILPPGGPLAPQIIAASNQGFNVIMGDGNDKVEAENVTVTVDNAPGSIGTNSAVALGPAVPASNQGFGIMMGNGHDEVEAEKITVTITGISGGLQGFGVVMGNGNDEVELEDVTVTGGQGLEVVVGNGNDEVDLGGDGDWSSRHDAINVTGEVFVQLGTGRDELYADNVTVGGNFDVEKPFPNGKGAEIELKKLTVAGNLTVNLAGDTGRDELKVSHTTVNGTTTFTGGSGTNDDYDPGHGNSFATAPVVTGFEN